MTAKQHTQEIDWVTDQVRSDASRSSYRYKASIQALKRTHQLAPVAGYAPAYSSLTERRIPSLQHRNEVC